MIARSTLQVTRWLGLLFAAVSLFLLAQRALGLGLSTAGGDFVASYRALFYPVANIFEPAVAAISNFLQLALPTWWRDGFVLYLMFGAAHYRHLTNEVSSVADALFAQGLDDHQARVSLPILTIAMLCAVVWPLSLLVLPLIDLSARALVDPAHAVRRFIQFYGQILQQVAILTAGSVLFLLFDAGLR
jgi:hypothetical protein